MRGSGREQYGAAVTATGKGVVNLRLFFCSTCEHSILFLLLASSLAAWRSLVGVWRPFLFLLWQDHLGFFTFVGRPSCGEKWQWVVVFRSFAFGGRGETSWAVAVLALSLASSTSLHHCNRFHIEIPFLAFDSLFVLSCIWQKVCCNHGGFLAWSGRNEYSSLLI